MLNLIKKNHEKLNYKIYNSTKSNTNLITKNKSLINEYKNTIYYPSSNKEWFNSVYSYSKSDTKLWTSKYMILYKILSSYCNILRNKIKKPIKRRVHNKTRYSANKIYMSRPELKNTNTKLSIILYTYNKKKFYIESHLRKLVILSKVYRILLKKNLEYVISYKNSTFNILKKKTYLKKVKGNVNVNYIKTHRNRILLLLKNNSFILKNWNMAFIEVKGNLLNYFILNLKKKNLYKIPKNNMRLIKKISKLRKRFFIIARDINLNKFKYNNFILTLQNFGVMSLIEKLYNKKVNIKLIEQKSIHLNSDTFSSAVALKLRDRKNKAVRVLRRAVEDRVKIPDLHTLITFDDKVDNISKNNLLTTLKQQVVSGVRFEASGRLTKRLTAMRAVFKYRYKGSLKNIRSSFNNKSSTMLRGYLKSNSQYTIINSKTRNGTFGLKGWISSH